jgi:hypothetical protein
MTESGSRVSLPPPPLRRAARTSLPPSLIAATSALWRIALVHMHCQATKDYVARRTAEGRTKKRDLAVNQALHRPRDQSPPAEPYSLGGRQR